MASPTGLVPSTNSVSVTVTAPEKLLATCPCLNVKLHLAEPSAPSISGTESKLGLAGVSVEQKILCSMSIAGDQATVHCNNCNHIVYTFPTLSSVQLEPTSLAFLNSSVLFSPSSGVVIPSEAIVTGDDIASLLKDTHYSKAFRLVLAPSPSSPTEAPSTISSNINSASQHLYQPHLERVRTLLDRELEANISAQQQQTEARIEAYKSQQQIALQESIASTRREKERLWAKIQDRVSAPPPPSVGEGHVNSPGLQPDSPLENGIHPFDGPSTLPIRLTSVSRDGLHGSLVDRRKSAVVEMAMSHQFREFDQRMASNSMRRQSLVPGGTPLPPAGLTPAPERSALSTSHVSVASEASHDSSTSPAPKPKKRVTIVDTVSIVEAVSHDDEESNIIGERSTFYNGNDDEDDDGEDGGVVFDLDEELGFDEEGQKDEFDENSDNDFTKEDDKGLNGGEGSSTNGSTGINISISRSSLPKSGMVVGSLRANYLRRQRGLEHHKRSLMAGPLGDGDGDDDDDDDLEDGGQPVTYFGTSLPIQIQARQPAIPLLPARTSAVASSLAMPPGSSPAAAMLQRRLSRAYGNDNTPEPQIGRSTSHRGSVSNLASSLADASLNTTTPGMVIIDPLMLLEEEHDADDREDRLRKHRQQFSSINHRRDLEQRRHELESTGSTTPVTTTATTAILTSSSFSQSMPRSAQADFEPPHVYSARTYVGDTPWEMPTRITVKSGGYQREGTHLDKQIALEIAQEQEMERRELAKMHSAVMDDSVTTYHHQQQLPRHGVDKIEEGEEEVDEEDEEAKKSRTTPSTA